MKKGRKIQRLAIVLLTSAVLLGYAVLANPPIKGMWRVVSPDGAPEPELQLYVEFGRGTVSLYALDRNDPELSGTEGDDGAYSGYRGSNMLVPIGESGWMPREVILRWNSLVLTDVGHMPPGQAEEFVCRRDWMFWKHGHIRRTCKGN